MIDARTAACIALTLAAWVVVLVLAAVAYVACRVEPKWRALVRARWEAQCAAAGKKMFIREEADDKPGRLLPPLPPLVSADDN